MDHLRKTATGTSSTDYAIDCLLPVMTQLFCHLGRHKFGQDLLRKK